jgi:hypothetical protein
LASPSYFDLEADGFHPSLLARSPWNPNNQSGVAVAALLTHGLERAPAAAPMMIARIVIDILRPVPLRTSKVAVRVTREGRRMQHLSADLTVDGELVASATALRVRLAETPRVMPSRTYPTPEEAPRIPMVRREPRRSGLETRVVSGRLIEQGPGIVWARVDGDLLPGVRASPLTTAMMACDLGSGISSEVDSRKWSYANLDISAYFVRPPRSEWILIDATTMTHGEGMGLVDSVLSDEYGIFGRAHQTLFITPL